MQIFFRKLNFMAQSRQSFCNDKFYRQSADSELYHFHEVTTFLLNGISDEIYQ